VVAAGANPVLITRGIEKTAKALVAELKNMSKEVFIFINGSLTECNDLNVCFVLLGNGLCINLLFFG